jgi:hypothetical protein
MSKMEPPRIAAGEVARMAEYSNGFGSSPSVAFAFEFAIAFAFVMFALFVVASETPSATVVCEFAY